MSKSDQTLNYTAPRASNLQATCGRCGHKQEVHGTSRCPDCGILFPSSAIEPTYSDRLERQARVARIRELRELGPPKLPIPDKVFYVILVIVAGLVGLAFDLVVFKCLDMWLR